MLQSVQRHLVTFVSIA